MGPEVLTRNQVRQLLDKLVPVQDIDGFYIGHLLAGAGRAHPARVFEFILNRHDFSLGLQKTADDWVQYQVVPRGSSLTDLHVLRETEGYARFLAQIRDRLADSGIEAYWLSDLFWAVGTLDDTTMMLADEWLHSGERTKLEAVLKLIGRGPTGVALLRPQFAIHLVDACAACARDLGDYSVGVLAVNALPKSGAWSPGQPPPGLVNLQEEAARLSAAFQVIPTGFRIFCEIVALATQESERSLRRDGEIGF